MQTVICEVCLKSELLCVGCADRLNRNEISQLEVDVSRALHSLSEKVKSLRDVRLRKVFDAGSLILIAGSGDGGRLVGKGGTVVKALAKTFGKSIRVLEESPDLRSFASALLVPAVVTGINILYKQDSEILRIRLAHPRRTTIEPEVAAAIISKLYNRPVEILPEA